MSNVVGRYPPRTPLTPSQADIWLQHCARPQSAQYNIALSYPLPVALDSGLFLRAVDWVFTRTDALYAQLVASDGSIPELLFDPANAPRGEFVDLTGEADPAQARNALLDRRDRIPFPQLGGSLARAALIKTGERDYTFACEFFHLVVDGWGSAIVFQRIARAYAALRAGQEPPAEAGSLADYLAECQADPPQPPREQDLAFWKPLLDAAMPPLAPSCALDAGEDENAAGYLRFSLSRETADRLAEVAAASNATLFHALVLAFGQVLGRHCGQTAPSFSLPILNRSKRHKETVGHFTETRALPVPLAADGTLAENLQAIARLMRELFRHYRVPANELNRLYHAAGHRGTPSPLAALSYVTRDFAAQVGGRAIPMGNRPAVHQAIPFVVYIFDTCPGQDLTIEFVYQQRHADADLAGLIVARVRRLLDEIARRPEGVLDAFDLMPPDERHRLAASLRREQDCPPAARPVIEDILDCVRRHPDAIAVESGTTRHSYRECLEHSHGIARALAGRHGVQPGDCVLLLLPRGAELVAAELGVMLAGATFVPVDPDAPELRAQLIARDARAKCVLTVSRLAAKARAVQATVVEADVIPGSAAPFPSRATPEQIAYIIYTSGSTGTPKGVEISHRALADHCASFLRETTQRAGGERVVHFFSPSFDASIEAVFPPLLLGNTIVAVPHPQWSAHEFARRLVGLKLTVLFLPPAFLFELLKQLRDEPGTIAGHRVSICGAGGDVMPAETAALCTAAFGPDTVLENVYGPTETTVTATVFRQPRGFRATPGEAIPIGRPRAGRLLRIVDGNDRDVPIGTEGELLIGGLGLARGYRNLPDETAARFVTLAEGRRFYRSGDLVRLRTDGEIVFRRRLDRQVKIRGFRIEPGEIEACLQSHPALHECAVEALPGAQAGSAMLRAFVSLRPGSPADATVLRHFLQERLPDYMVPVVTLLDHLPKNNGGKIDRQALRNLPLAAEPARNGGPVAHPPIGPVQEFLASLWSRTLNTPANDVTADFFAQGGDSLLAANLITAINRAFRVEFPLAAFFAHPTVAGVTVELERLVGDRARLEKMAAVRLELARLNPEQIRDRLAQARVAVTS